MQYTAFAHLSDSSLHSLGIPSTDFSRYVPDWILFLLPNKFSYSCFFWSEEPSWEMKAYLSLGGLVYAVNSTRVVSFWPASLGRQPSRAPGASPNTCGNRGLQVKNLQCHLSTPTAFWLFQDLKYWRTQSNCFLPLLLSACRKWEILKQGYSTKLICQRTSEDLKQISILFVLAFTLKWLLMQFRCYDCFKELLCLAAHLIYFIDIVV